MKIEIKNILILLVLTTSVGINAQFKGRMSKETKILFVVHAGDYEIQDLIRYSDAEKLGMKLAKKYPKSAFYHGVLKGRYSVEKTVSNPY